jgi:serine O-acetyltransferase
MSAKRDVSVPQTLVDQLVDSYLSLEQGYHHLGRYELPAQSEIAGIVEDLRELLFPGFGGRPAPSGEALRGETEDRIGAVAGRLRRQLYRGFRHRCEGQRGAGGDCDHCANQANEVVQRFLTELPEIRARLVRDAEAAFEGDPAATGIDEIIFCYPGLFAITAYRIANSLHRLGADIIPRMIAEHAHARTGIDIHPGATIGDGFFIDHGTGVVIGETTVIGSRVRVYQGVTLGALSLPRPTARAVGGRKRHPTIDDEVVIYANATILGGDTVIGRGAVIGGNSFITESVPAGTRVASR